MVEVEQKIVWKSKTFWVAVVTMLIGIFGSILTFMQEYEPKYLYIVIFVIGVLNVILRMLSGQPVAFKDIKKVIDDTEKAKDDEDVKPLDEKTPEEVEKGKEEKKEEKK
jgi:hypothetical protein